MTLLNVLTALTLILAQSYHIFTDGFWGYLKSKKSTDWVNNIGLRDASASKNWPKGATPNRVTREIWRRSLKGIKWHISHIYPRWFHWVQFYLLREFIFYMRRWKEKLIASELVIDFFLDLFLQIGPGLYLHSVCHISWHPKVSLHKICFPSMGGVFSFPKPLF